MLETKQRLRYSVVIPVGARVDAPAELLAEYDEALRRTRESYEIIVVLDGPRRDWLSAAQAFCAANERVHVIELARAFGESAALSAGFDAANGEVLVTLPAYYQVAPSEIPKLLEAASDNKDDVLIAVRWPRAGSGFDKLRRSFFHRSFKFTSGMQYRDLGCGVRALKRAVAKEVSLYGDQHRFLPALAARRGFRVREVELAQSPHDRFRGNYRLRDYLHGFLDVLTVFFLVRFTKKPLRFFGTIGFLAASVGALFTAVLIVQRMFFDIPLADRPALLIGSLMVVRGVQTFALGLIGELIIFTHARNMKEYAIRSVIRGGVPAEEQGSVAGAAGGSAARTAQRGVTRLS